MLRKSLAFVVVALLLAAGASAQSVGLVLSGGGAKGLYHIGVIQALEENEIPIDYVAGTSMGSIIAALYAAGYSPEEMRAIVDSGQVREWVSGRIDSRYASYYRQMQDQPSMLTLRLNLRDEEKRSDAKNKSRLVLPSHLISSSQIDLALAELLTPASTASGGDFDRLMVPFRCVASDLVARKPYVLKTGDLGEAVRASMAIPLAFNPIEKDSMLLYDGGIYDNFPWKPLDETFRPDYLIGSKCTSGNTEPNAKSIMDQVWMLTMEKTDYDMPAGRSTLIERAVDVSMLDFSQADAIIQSGYDDTMALMDSLKSAVPRRMSRGEALRRRAAFRERCPELLFNRYAIEGLNPAQTTYVRDNMQLDHQHDGEPKILSFERVKDKYFSVLADGNFSTEYPYMRYDPKSGYYGIDFRLTTKPDYKILIGGNISSTAFNQAYVGFEYHRIRHAANRYYTHLFLGPVSSAVMLGGRTDFFLWRPLFVDYSYNFTARNYKNGNFGNLTSVSNTESMKFLENFLSLGFGFPVTHRSAFVIRLNGGQERYYYSLDRASYKENYYEDLTTLNYISPKIELRRSSLDRMIFPHSGTSLSLSGIYLYGRDRFVPSPYSRDEQRLRKSKRDVSWWGARIVWNQYFQISGSKWFSLGYGAEAVVTTIPTLSNDKVTRMLMPAYRPTLHSQTVYMPEYRAKRYAAVSVMPTFDFSDRFFLRTGIYAMFAERFRPTDDRMRYIVDASLVYHTGIGPISLSLTKYNVKNWDNLFLTFNFGYAMFRPRGIHSCRPYVLTIRRLYDTRTQNHGGADLRLRRYAGDRPHAGVRFHSRRRPEQQGVLERRQFAGRGAGRRHDAHLHGQDARSGALAQTVAAPRGVPGVGTQHPALSGREGVVRPHQRLCRRAGRARAALHQFVGLEGDDRGDAHRVRVPQDLRLLVPLRRRRHRLLARRGGQLHQ